MPDFDLTDPIIQTTAAVLGAAAVIIWALWYAVRRRKGKVYVSPALSDEIAHVVETVTLTSGGRFAQVLLALHNLFIGAVFFVSPRSAIQEASLGTIWISGNVLWGFCMMMGRRSTYRVMREPDPVETAEPQA